jgi:CO dehydrogenase maturation factor
MKIAITGKGGVGKTTIAALLSHIYSSEGRRVIAVDADPDANLASALGLSEDDMRGIRPIADMPELIEERTGAKPGSIGGVFRLNPKVDDIPDEFGYTINGIRLLVLGRSKSASSGCYCPENALLRRLLKHLVLERDEVIIVDMEAGIEHLTRGTTEGVNAFIVVVEPGQRSIQTALTIRGLAEGLGIKRVFIIANKVRGEDDIEFIKESLRGFEFLGAIKFNTLIIESDMKGIPSYRASGDTLREVRAIKERLEGLI